MFKENQINFYTSDINFRKVVENQNLKSTDEALFVCDLEKLKEKYETWKQNMPRIKPYYGKTEDSYKQKRYLTVKCNDDNFVVKTLAALGANFDCASKNEIKQVLDLNVDPDRIIFANPCKPVTHLEYAQKRNVKTSTVDTEFEIKKIHKTYPESNLVIRFRCDAKQAICPLGDKFGCDAESDATALMLLAKSLNLNVIGVSFHVGSGCNDFPAYDRAITTAKSLFQFGSLVGYDMSLLDIGGGFPGSDDEKFSIIAEIVNKSISRHFPTDNVHIIAEPGRFFVASAYTLICKIHAKREARSPTGKLLTKMYYLNDGVYGSFNCVLSEHREVTVKYFLDEETENLPKFNSLIWGPTCDALDKIADNIQLPDLKCGDYLIFPNMGAYSLSIASTFNGFALPKIVYFQKIKYDI